MPSVFSYAVANNRSVQQKKMERYESAAKRKILFDTPVQNNKKLKMTEMESTPEKPYYTAAPCSPFKLSNKANTCGTSPMSPMSPLDKDFLLSPCNKYSMNRPVSKSERQMLYTEMDNLRSERDAVKLRNNELVCIIDQTKLSSNLIENNKEKAKFYTGLKWDTFLSIFTFLQTFMSRTPLANKIPLRDQFFVTLVKLRLDMPYEYLADHCGIPTSTFHDMFWRWINLMSNKLDFLINMPHRETLNETLPSIFRNKYPRLTCIIDCFEIFIERPQKLEARAKCYSNYKKHSTVKVLIGCSPLGSVCFLSTVWGGRVSDNEIVRSSGFMSPYLHHPGDQILADRGFTLTDDFATTCSVDLVIPAFTKGKRQLSAQDVESSRKMSSIRIHIERVIGLIKNRYKILQGTLSITSIKSLNEEASDKTEARIDKLIRLCGALTNLGEGIVYNENESTDN